MSVNFSPRPHDFQCTSSHADVILDGHLNMSLVDVAGGRGVLEFSLVSDNENVDSVSLFSSLCKTSPTSPIPLLSSKNCGLCVYPRPIN